MDLLPGDNLIYMKVGVHAQETLEDILNRKRKEIDDEGFSMWGYGGSTCHPRTMVQPFAAAAEGRVLLVMEEIVSKHFAEPARASLYSSDGIDWQSVPAGINVLGSRYALCIDTLDDVEMMLDLASTHVAVGNSLGRNGDAYVKGRVDKACLTIDGIANDADHGHSVKLSLAAELIAPFAVFLKD
jgi:hypothetical protein